MTCAGCVRTVERALLRVEGVTGASVNLVTGKATVSLAGGAASEAADGANPGIAELAEAVRDAGYEASEGLPGAPGEPDLPTDAPPAPLQEGSRQAGQAGIQTPGRAGGYDRRLKADFLLAAAITLPVAVIGMLPLRPLPFLNLYLLGLTGIVVFYCGRRFIVTAIRNALRFRSDMNTLIAVGSLSAYLYSALITLFPSLLMAGLGTAGAGLHADAAPPDSAHAVYFETAAVIVTLILGGRLMESRARKRTLTDLGALHDLLPLRAGLIVGGSEREVRADALRPGDLVRIKPGEKIPADGAVLTGATTVDESILTGESLPVGKKPGDEVLAATLNHSGALDVRVMKFPSETLYARIVESAEQALTVKAPVERLADRISSVFVPSVIALALAVFAAWYLSGGDFSSSLRNFIAVLIVACPCALGIATPTAVVTGTGAAALRGILIKSPEGIEISPRVDTVLLDKTGTLTMGAHAVTSVRPHGARSVEELLGLAASVEQYARHPAAGAIVAEAKRLGIEPGSATDFRAVDGIGVEGVTGGRTVRVGAWGHAGVEVSVDGETAGTIELADRLKPDAAEAVRDLEKLGLEVIIATGDQEAAAGAVAKELGVEKVHARLLPTGKLDLVKRLQAEGKVVAVVGDGVNDAPALAASDLGVALGTGSDAAKEAGVVTIVSGDLGRIAEAFAILRRTMAVVRQNLALSFLYNVLLIPVAALGYLDPMLAAAAMALSSVSVVGNSLRLRRARRG